MSSAAKVAIIGFVFIIVVVGVVVIASQPASGGGGGTSTTVCDVTGTFSGNILDAQFLGSPTVASPFNGIQVSYQETNCHTATASDTFASAWQSFYAWLQTISRPAALLYPGTYSVQLIVNTNLGQAVYTSPVYQFSTNTGQVSTQFSYPFTITLQTQGTQLLDKVYTSWTQCPSSSYSYACNQVGFSGSITV